MFSVRFCHCKGGGFHLLREDDLVEVAKFKKSRKTNQLNIKNQTTLLKLK